VISKLVTSFWFRALLSATVLVYLLTRLDGHEALGVVVAVDAWYFLAAIAIDAGTRATMISRWFVLLRSRGAAVSVWDVTRIFFVTSFIGTALPTGGADVARAYALSRQTDDGRAALASVTVDRLLGVAALTTIAIVGLTLAAPEEIQPLGQLGPFVAGASVVTVGALVAAIWADRLARTILPASAQQTRLGRWLVETADNVVQYRDRRGILAAVFGQSLVVQGLRILEVFVLATGLGLDVSLVYYLIFMPVGLLAFMLPVSVAGIGVPQGVFVWLLRPAGVADASAFALSTLFVLVGVLGTLPGLYLHLRARNEL
jgi:uncharacterized protein (TIRG00374 family)